MRVHFSVVDEFLQELQTERGQVEDGILRVTFLHRHDKQLPIMHITVYAGCIIRGRIVELRQYVGDSWTKPEPNDKVRAKAEEIRAKIITTAVTELHLDVRSGIFES